MKEVRESLEMRSFLDLGRLQNFSSLRASTPFATLNRWGGLGAENEPDEKPVGKVPLKELEQMLLSSKPLFK